VDERKPKFLNDRYKQKRGGSSYLITLFCAHCSTQLLVYQKDGKGSLIRLYLDRIIAPKELTELQNIFHFSRIPPLVCPKCQRIIGAPMIYAPEKRRAIRLIHGSFLKKKS